MAAEVASSISWLKLWDMALDYSPRGTASLQALFRELTRPSFGSKPCHLCDIDHLCVPYFDHFISSIEVSSDFIVHQLAEGDRSSSSMNLQGVVCSDILGVEQIDFHKQFCILVTWKNHIYSKCVTS